MRTFAKFESIGFVGNIKEVGPTLRVSIATNYGTGDEKKTSWNEVTLFNETAIKWVSKNVGKGDLVRAAGNFETTSYENDAGATVYGVTFAARDFDLLRKKTEADDD